MAATNFSAVGRKYGVSGNAVRKWVRWYEAERERVVGSGDVGGGDVGGGDVGPGDVGSGGAADGEPGDGPGSDPSWETA